MIVKDINFKISIVFLFSEYTNQIVELHENHADESKGSTFIPEVINFIEKIQLDVNEISNIYDSNLYDFELLFHNKEVDTTVLNVKSIEGIEQFTELTNFEPSSLFKDPKLDFSPLLKCEKLEDFDCSSLEFNPKQHLIFEQLKERDVLIYHQPIDLKFLNKIKGEKYKETIEHIKDHPYSTYYWLELGEELHKNKKYDLALSSYRYSMSVNLTVDNCDALGRLYIDLGQYEEAIVILQKGLDLDEEYYFKDHHKLYFNLGVALSKTGQFEAALAAFRSGVEQNPNGLSFLNITQLLLQIGDQKQAYINCVKAIYNGDIAQSHLLKGHCHAIAGEEQKALLAYAYCRKALKSKFEATFLESIEKLSHFKLNGEHYLNEIEQVKLPKFNLLEVPSQLKYARFDHDEDLKDEQIEILRQHSIPAVYIDWLIGCNTSYNTDILLHNHENYEGIKLKNYQSLLETIDGSVPALDYLTKQGYKVFAEGHDTLIAFDTGKVVVLTKDEFELARKSDKQLSSSDFRSNYASFEEFMSVEHLPFILPIAFDAQKMLKTATDSHLVRYLEKLIENPTDPLWYYNLSVTYHRLKHYELGLVTSVHYMYFKTDPEVELKHHDALYDFMAILCVYTKRLKTAEKYYKKALELNPKKAITWSNLGRLYMNSNRREQGIESFKKCAEMDPQEIQAYMTLGFHLIAMNRPQEALHYANEGVKYGNITNSYLNKGHVHLIEGNETLAVECYAYSKRAFATEKEFWQDYDGDFELLPQYGFTLEYYNSLKEKIGPAMEQLPPLKLNEWIGLWDKYDRQKYKEFNEEDLEFLEAVKMPEIYEEWLNIKHESYETNLYQVSEIEYSVEMYNVSGLTYANWTYRRYLHQNGYFIFGEDQDRNYYAFNPKNEIILLSNDLGYNVQNLYDDLYSSEMEDGTIKPSDIIKPEKIQADVFDYDFWNYDEEDFLVNTPEVLAHIEQHTMEERYDNFLEFLEINYKKANEYLK